MHGNIAVAAPTPVAHPRRVHVAGRGAPAARPRQWRTHAGCTWQVGARLRRAHASGAPTPGA
ncbi:MAG: hypothetical protein NZM94_13690, partial [Roseiflexus sp.]|nr:hypothetical protein [Roseiflexus sp.]